MFTSAVERWDAGSEEWQACAPLTTPRIHSAVAAAAGSLFVVGGSSQINQVLASVEMYTPPAQSSSLRPTRGAPAGGGGGGAG